MVNKRLQIFISSTYEDLKVERQAAVQAILKMKHIPAGMELFTSGDKSQWDIIKKWIDGSDIFMLILGGRYGSIEKTQGKSYIHLEYEYALNTNKPYFVLILDDTYIENKVKELTAKNAMEFENRTTYEAFKSQIMERMCAFCSELKDISTATYESILSLMDEYPFVGWVPGNQSENVVELIDRVAKLANENSILKQKLSEIEGSLLKQTSDMPIAKIIEVLSSQTILLTQIKELPQNYQKRIYDNFEEPDIKNINFKRLCEIILPLIDGVTPVIPTSIFKNLYKFGIINWKINSSNTFSIPELTKEGRDLLFTLSNENPDLLFQIDKININQVNNPKVLKISRKIKSLSGKPAQELLVKKTIEYITTDKEWKNDLMNGVDLSSIRELFVSVGIEIEPLKYGCAKFVEILQILLKDTDLCVYRIQSSEVKVGFRRRLNNYNEVLPDLEIREKHSPELYKSILATGSPIFRFPSFGEMTVICIAIEKNPIVGLSIGDSILAINKASDISLQEERIKSTLVGLYNAKILAAEPENAPLVEKLFTLRQEFNLADKMKEEAVNQMSKKITSIIGEPCKIEILISALNMK